MPWSALLRTRFRWLPGFFEEAIDGEVTALDVTAGSILEVDVVRVSAIRIGALAAKGGHLDVSAIGIGVGNQNNAKVLPNQTAIGKGRKNERRPRTGCDIKVLGGNAQQAITHAAAHQEGRMPLGTQNPNYFKRKLFVSHL